MVIERNPERMHDAIEQGFLAVEADASRTRTCCGGWASTAPAGLSPRSSTDAENVYAVLSARLLKPDLFIVGRAETEDARTKLKRAGADRVISPYQLGGLQLAQTALRPAVVDFVQLATSSDNLDLNWSRCTSRPDRRSTAAAWSTPACASASAWSWSASAAPTAGWTSTRSRRRRCAPATSSSCSAAADSLRELEAAAAE